MKLFRRISAFFLGALLCAAAGTAVCSAAGNTYAVPEIEDMQITLSDDMTAITRSADANDRFFSLQGLDYTSTMENMQRGNIYLQAADSLSSVTLTVSMTETDESKGISDYMLLGYNELSDVARNFLAENEYIGCTVDEGEKVNWLLFNKKDDASNQYVFQANTVYGGKIVNITLQRNGGSVIPSDYAVFNAAVSSVEFHKAAAGIDMMPFMLIGGAVILILAVIVLILIIRSAKRRRKKSKNDKILEELAGQYTTRRGGKSHADEPAEKPAAPVETDYEETAYSEEKTDASASYADEYEPQDGERRYSDAEISALLGETEEPEDFQEALPEPVEEPSNEPTAEAAPDAEAEPDDTIDNADGISEFFEDDLSLDIALDTESEEIELTDDVPDAEDTAEAEPIGEDAAQPQETETEEPTAEEIAEEAETEEPEAQEAEADEADEPDESDEDDDEDDSAAPRYDLDDFDEQAEHDNDEVLVREESKQSRFKDSDDFFEEAPHRTVGVISSREIAEAEEYDVIGEVEKRATEVEKETPSAGENVSNAVKKVGGGLKYFGTHIGYFATNVTREVKRSRAKKKRQKAEEERRRRARERQLRQRQSQRNPQSRPTQRPDGLVQVRSRDGRRK